MLAQITKNQLAIHGNTQLVQGTVGETLQLAVSEEWTGLALTAVFAAGEQRRDVVVTGTELTIPWELLREAGHKLTLSFHGAAVNGGIVLRSNIASLGVIRRSYEPSGEEPDAPSPARADQIQALAAQALALAEAVRSEAERGDYDGADGVSPTLAVTAIEGGHRVTVTDGGGTRSFDVLDGASAAVDPALSGTSENPVQNKVIKAALDELAGKDFFVAEYGTTGIAALEEAYQAGKTLLCIRNGKLYSFTGRVEDPQGWEDPSYFFGRSESDGYREANYISDQWSGAYTARTSLIAPLMDGTAAIGSSSSFARANHVHPSDTSRLAANQGAANAGKYLVVRNDGAVVPTDGPSAQAVDAALSGSSTNPVQNKAVKAGLEKIQVQLWVTPGGGWYGFTTIDATGNDVPVCFPNIGTNTGLIDPIVLPLATQSAKGAMSASDKTKLDGIDMSAKLNANQGAANAGKFMVVGSDGTVAPVTMTAWQGGNY